VNRLLPTVLRAALFFLPVAVGHCADAFDDVPESAAPQVANSNTAMRTVPAGARRGTLDLRPPDLQSLHVQTLQPAATPPESDETEALDIAAAPSRPQESPDTQPPPGGIGSLYWAVRHPRQAWRILLPIQLDGDEVDIERHDRAAGCATPETLTERRDLSAKPAPAALVHDTGTHRKAFPTT